MYVNCMNCQQQPDCYFPFYLSKKACVFSGWGCDVQLKGRIETDYLVNSWHPLAAWNRPEHQGLICKWITLPPSPPLLLPSAPPHPPLPVFLPFLCSFSFCVCVCMCVHSVPRSSFYIVPWQMLCRAAIVSHQFFWGCEESQKISTCDFNAGVPPAVKHCASFFVYLHCNLHSFGAGRNFVESYCFSLNNGEIFLWLRWVIIGRYEKDRLQLRENHREIDCSLCLPFFFLPSTFDPLSLFLLYSQKLGQFSLKLGFSS